MPYKWKPSASQRKAFTQKMQDPLAKAAYEKSKRDREDKRRSTSKFDYGSAGGKYVPTRTQYEFAINNMNLFKTGDEKAAANDVIYGYTSNEKVHHDSIHIVNEKMRNTGMNEVKNLLRKIIKEELQKINEVEINRPDLIKDAKRYAEIANKMKVLEDELKSLEKEFVPLDQEFREVLENVEDVKDTFIRAGNILIKVEKAGYDRTNMKYKEGFDWLLNRVNGAMKSLVQEALDLSKSSTYIKSKIAVVGESKLLIKESWFSKVLDFMKNKLKKIFGLTKQVNTDMDKLEKMI